VSSVTLVILSAKLLWLEGRALVELAERKRRPVGVVSLDNEWLL